MIDKKVVTASVDETIKVGEELGLTLQAGDIVCLFGDLAAGKTTLVKGLAKTLSQTDLHEVNSPTFTYLHIYSGPKIVYHFDLYRLQNEKEFITMGFDEYLYAGGVSCIEWSERIEALLPENYVRVSMSHLNNNQREITITHSRSHA